MISKATAQKTHRPAEPLETRHVFLDTQVFRALGHNPQNPAMILLKDQIAAHHIVLHTTDITALEVKRQIRELVLAKQRELGALEKHFRRWRKAAGPSALGGPHAFDAEKVSTEIFKQFGHFLEHDCEVQIHPALRVDPKVVFEQYFQRKAPFDGEDSKEFPDAFALEVLRAWCADKDQRMCIVTRDGPMLRAAADDPNLLPFNDFNELLRRAAAELDAMAEAAAEQALQSPAFDQSLEDFLRNQIGELVFVYTGELPDGEAYEGQLMGIEHVDNWSVVALSGSRISLILEARLKVLVEVQYEDRDHAFYDREDGRWFGGEPASAEIEDEVDVQVLVEIERSNGQLRDGKLLTSEVDISGLSDSDY